MQGFVCGPRIYEYEGWTFEQGYCGLWPVYADDAGQDFFDTIARFEALPEAERETYRRGGGCVRLA